MGARVALLATLLALAAPRAAAEPAGLPADHAPYEALQARIIEISEQVKPSVVHVEAIVKVNDRRSQVTGSGLAVRPEGLVLTNHHVVEKAEKVTVLVPGRKPKYEASVMGSDPQTDVAVLRIAVEEPLPAARFGDSDAVRVGQWVLAIGNPYGLEGTVSLGIVSAKSRNLNVDQVLNDFIQTDAMIDRGSSGGPLVDLEGRVVGINSRGQGRGIGFTIPIRTALEVMRQIEEGGIERGWLGVTVQPLDRELASYFGVPGATGVVVNSVSAGSPAAGAGLRPGDILVAAAGEPLEAEKEEDLRSFQRQVASLAPGQEVELAVLRAGERRVLRARIGVQPKVEPDEVESGAGFHVQEITESLYRRERLESRQGAYVSFVERGSPAAEAGMLPGDVIERIEEAPVRDLADFRAAVRRVAGKGRFLVHARRGDETKFLLISPRPAPEAEDRAGDDPGQAAHTTP